MPPQIGSKLDVRTDQSEYESKSKTPGTAFSEVFIYVTGPPAAGKVEPVAEGI